MRTSSRLRRGTSSESEAEESVASYHRNSSSSSRRRSSARSHDGDGASTVSNYSVGNHSQDDDDNGGGNSCGFSLDAETTPSTEFSTRRRSSLHMRIEPAQRDQFLKDLPIAQLKTSCKHLYGRQDEINTLLEGFENLTKSETRQLVLISGYSGTGKSALARTLVKPVRKAQGLYALGKFDQGQHVTSAPYSAISMACREICGAILHSADKNPKDYQDLQKNITRQLGAELPMLIQLIPTLEEIVFSETISLTSVSEMQNINKGLTSVEAKHRMTYAFQRFLRLVTRQFQSLVLVVDDLQWADSASLELLEKLLFHDPELNSVMVIGLYRSNEVTEAHPVHLVLKDWKSKATERKNCQVTEVKIGNLDLPAITNVIQDMLKAEDDPSTVELADLCYKKTSGNIFFLRLLLSTLYENKLLYYNIGALKWAWDKAGIEETIPATDNVIDLLRANMSNLPDGNVELLKLAGCLGSIFPITLLETILVSLSGNISGSRKSITKALLDVVNDLVKEGYFKRRGDDYIQFAHDRIQETSALLVPEEERLDYHYRVGKILLERLREDDLDDAIFVIADLLNKGTIAPTTSSAVKAPPEERISQGSLTQKRQMMEGDLDLANLNCRACRKAFGLAAFQAAADYARRGIEFLGGDEDEKWTKHYQLSLDLYSMAAEAESFLGNMEVSDRYCRQVISRKATPIDDKFRVYHTLIDSTFNRGELDEAIRLNIELLERFNCRFPKDKVSGTICIWANVASIKYRMNTWSTEGLKKLKVTEDPVRIELSRLLDKLATCLYQAHDARMPLIIFRNLHWTQKYGMSTYSPAAIATTAVVLAGVLQDFKGGVAMGKAALKLLDKVQSRQLVESRVYVCVYCFVYHWTAPMKDMLMPLLHGYNSGLNAGDTESASVCIRFFINMRLMLGTPLVRVEQDCKTYSVQMKDLERTPVAEALTVIRQFCLNLMGKGTSGDPLVLDGDSIGKEQLDQIRKQNIYTDVEAVQCEDVLCTYFGAHEKLAAKVLAAKGADLTAFGSCILIPHAVARGVSSFAAYKKTRKKGYLKMGMLMRSKVKTWLDKGNPNVLHLAAFLDAEYEATKGVGMVTAVKHFESAVVLSARGGFLLDAALVSERLGEFYLANNDEENASFRLSQAVKYYADADAYGKVNDLENKYSRVVRKAKEVVKTSSTPPIQVAMIDFSESLE